MDYDVLVIGGGAAGMESAITLGDMGYSVLLVEKEPTIGGKMILLSKVFPTLDCASCIATPKMAATAHHPNVMLMVYTEVKDITKNSAGTFEVRINQKPTFVNPSQCSGCQKCEEACTVVLPDQFNYELVARRAAYIPFPQAIPKKALIERQGISPCSFTCPAGVKAHGYVSLVRSGLFEEAFHLHMEEVPLPGCLSRVCFAPCEKECSREQVDGAVSIREIKRFMVDRYYQEHPEPECRPPKEVLDHKIAIVGSGPAGLTAAYNLARKGYRVTIFESAASPGGLLRYGIPDYRLPRRVLDRDIKNVTALGVTIQTQKTIHSLKSLKDDGFNAIFLGLGAMAAWKKPIPGEDLHGVMDSMTFLREFNFGRSLKLKGKTVMVLGSGNAAMDPARMALRMGAAKVIIQYRESIDYRKYWGNISQKQSRDRELEAQPEKGLELHLLKTPKRFIGKDGYLSGVESLTIKKDESDPNGTQRHVTVNGSEETVSVDLVILALGIRPNTMTFRHELKINWDGTIAVNPETLETSMPSVFAGGDVAIGPSSVAEAVGQGRRAAFYIDRYLQGKILTKVTFDTRLPMVDKQSVLTRLGAITKYAQIKRQPAEIPEIKRSVLSCMYENQLNEIKKQRAAIKEGPSMLQIFTPIKGIKNYLLQIEPIFKHYPHAEASLIMMLQEIQDTLNWLPPEVLDRVAKELSLPRARIQSVATFYRAFALEPRGKKLIKVCLGTTCHVRGAPILLEQLERRLKIKAGHGCTEDGMFSLETVNCVGACAMAPAIVVGENYYANMTSAKLDGMLKKERQS